MANPCDTVRILLEGAVKVLWVKSELLHPVDKGGKIRTFEMLRRWHVRHRITYLALLSPETPAAAAESTMRFASGRSVRSPNIIVPRHSGETLTPVRPSER